MTHSLTVAEAIEIATAWIHRSGLPFTSAFIGGSVVTADASSPHDPLSDIDCYLVVDADPPKGKIGKIGVDGVLLDVSWISWKHLETSETDAVMASLLHFGQVVVDDGRLSALQRSINKTFTRTEMIGTRLESMRTKIRDGLSADSSHLSLPEQVMNWLFPATLATHIPLITACVPLTVRKRFLAAREVMEPNRYESLLALYGFDAVDAGLAQAWLDSTARLFDETIGFAATSNRFWATDIQGPGRQIAIDASQRLIDHGLHREALFWILATSARCLVVREDAGVDYGTYVPAFTAMLNEIRVRSATYRGRRTNDILTWIDEDIDTWYH